MFTGKFPFESYSDKQVVLLLAKGIRPDKPNNKEFTRDMWALTQKCWKQDPKKRPVINEVLKKLKLIVGMSSFFLFFRGGYWFTFEEPTKGKLYKSNPAFLWSRTSLGEGSSTTHGG